jgi:enoyl-CoA hydratase
MSAVEVEVEQGIATLTLNVPGTRNALNPATSRELSAACDGIDRDPEVGAVIVRGGGGTFCSGAERDVLGRISEDPADPERYADLSTVYDAFVRVGSLSVPTIAAVRGAAVGAGVNLLLATDLRIVARDARIIGGFMRIGLHPGGGHFTLVGRLAGREAAGAIGLFGAEISGARAAEIGLAWEAVDAGEVDERARELAATPARDPELARKMVATMRSELGAPGVAWPVALEMERGPQMWSLRRRSTGGAPGG